MDRKNIVDLGEKKPLPYDERMGPACVESQFGLKNSKWGLHASHREDDEFRAANDKLLPVAKRRGEIDEPTQEGRTAEPQPLWKRREKKEKAGRVYERVKSEKVVKMQKKKKTTVRKKGGGEAGTGWGGNAVEKHCDLCLHECGEKKPENAPKKKNREAQ